MNEKKEYVAPEIVYEVHMEVKAGSPRPPKDFEDGIDLFPSE